MNLKTILTILFLCILYLNANCQVIEHRNDSLFINNTFANEHTDISELEKILHSEAKIKLKKSKFNGEKTIITNYYFHELGILFMKFDNQPERLDLVIKLYSPISKRWDTYSGLKSTFKGNLIIENNLINHKRKIGQLSKLENCAYEDLTVQVGPMPVFLGGFLKCANSSHRLNFDFDSKLLTSLVIQINNKSE